MQIQDIFRLKGSGRLVAKDLSRWFVWCLEFSQLVEVTDPHQNISKPQRDTVPMPRLLPSVPVRLFRPNVRIPCWFCRSPGLLKSSQIGGVPIPNRFDSQNHPKQFLPNSHGPKCILKIFNQFPPVFVLGHIHKATGASFRALGRQHQFFEVIHQVVAVAAQLLRHVHSRRSGISQVGCGSSVQQ